MSEKMYAWLLRLYPAAFRERYGEELRALLDPLALTTGGIKGGGSSG